MERLTNAIFVVLVSIMAAGCCAAPGSALGSFQLIGHVDHGSAHNEPLTVKIVLPKEYGLGGLDQYFGKPEDYGHKDLVVYEQVDQQGNFSIDHENVYHISCLLFPPIGPIPRTPPPPSYFVAFSNVKDEVYLVGFKERDPVYKVYRVSTRTEITKGEAFWKITGGSVEDTVIDGGKGLLIRLTFERS